MQYRKLRLSSFFLGLSLVLGAGLWISIGTARSIAGDTLAVSHGASCDPGQKPGTRCCSPEVPPKWWCTGSVELLGACTLQNGHEGRLLKCAPVDAKKLSARKGVEE